MNYLVMEVHPAYAVVLDEEGRFLKAANLHYQVGDTVHEIIALQVPRRKNTYLWKAVSGLAGLAACFCLIFFGYYQPNFTPYGSLRIRSTRTSNSHSAAPTMCWIWKGSIPTARR